MSFIGVRKDFVLLGCGTYILYRGQYNTLQYSTVVIVYDNTAVLTSQCKF